MSDVLELKLNKPNRLAIDSRASDASGTHWATPRTQASITSFDTAPGEGSPDYSTNGTSSPSPKKSGSSIPQTPGSRSQISSSTETGDEAIPKKLNKGMSSLKTVLTVAGLLCVGFMFIMSGIILMATEHDAVKQDMFITGAVFMAIGLFMLIVCAILQRKNFCRNVDKLEDELFGKFRHF